MKKSIDITFSLETSKDTKIDVKLRKDNNTFYVSVVEEDDFPGEPAFDYEFTHVEDVKALIACLQAAVDEAS